MHPGSRDTKHSPPLTSSSFAGLLGDVPEIPNGCPRALPPSLPHSFIHSKVPSVYHPTFGTKRRAN